MASEEKQVEEIDIEQYSKEGKTPPKGHHYVFMVDRQRFIVKQECMTGREILTLAGKTPVERFRLNQRLHGGETVKIGYDQPVCFTDPGIERFMTIPLDQTDGSRQ
jgi:hypothetical protein